MGGAAYIGGKERSGVTRTSVIKAANQQIDMSKENGAFYTYSM